MRKLFLLFTAKGKEKRRKMARFSVGGDEDENEERPANNRPLPKKPRFSTLIYAGIRKTNAAAPSTSNAGGGATVSTPGNPSAPEPPAVPELLQRDSGAVEEESEAESFHESDSSASDFYPEEDSEEEGEEEEGEEEEEEEEEEEDQNQPRGNDVQSTEARVDSTPKGNGSFLDSGGGSIRLTLTDPDVLDCPICFDPLCSPVYQCENGHIACASCCTKIRNKCSSCCLPIGYNRCRAMEKVLESVRTGCRNMPYGCKDTFSYSQKLTHEKTCNYAPCSCPHLDCEYVAISKYLYTHFALQHSHSSREFRFNSAISISLDITQKHVFLQERIRSTLFILNHSIESLGSFVNVVCIAPTTAKRPFSYDLTATAGESSVKLKTFAECMPEWMPQPPGKKFLLVPKDFISVNGQLQLELIIQRDLAICS